ncbi:MAG TPA: tetratricopeptide repeat protein [Terriglobia bacterium]|nr:tetratricopeptide repeat protein [Terriglobia bacterium]
MQAFLLVVLLVSGCEGFSAVPQPRVPIKSPKHEEKAQATSFAALYQSGISSLRAGRADRAIESLTQAVHLDPSSKPARCALGQAFINAGQPVESVEQFQKCVELAPHDSQSQYNLGQAYLQLALTMADRLLASNATSSYARRIFAENYVGKNDLTEAETQYLLALQTDPEARDLQLALGDLYLRMGKPARAREEFQKVLDVVPASIVARYKLAEVDFLEGDFASALTRLGLLDRLNPGFLQLHPDFPELLPLGASLNDVCTRFSKFALTAPEDLAPRFLENACLQSLAPETASIPSITGSGEARPLAHVSGAEEHELTPGQLCLSGLCRACEDRLRSVATGSFPTTETLSELGQCAYDAGDYESAYAYFLEAEKRDARNLASLYWLQESARRLAARCFERIRQIDPDSYLVHLLNARSWEEQQQPARAIQEYRAAVARRPDAVNVRVLLGHLQWEWQEYDDALPQLMEALRLDPAEPVANYLVGDIWVQEHHPEKAMSYLNKAISLRPGFLNAEASLGRALTQLGRVQEALEELKAVASADQDGSIHYELYQIYLKLGRNDEAKAALAVGEKIRSQHRRRPTDLP